VAAFGPDPIEAHGFGHLFQLPVGNQAQPGQAVTSTCQVPTKAGNGSSRSPALR
jgi:hypothetical protein